MAGWQKQDKISMVGLWCVLVFFACQATYLGLTYILGDPAFLDPLFKDKYIQHLTLVRTHGVSAAFALVAGLLQFNKWTLKRRIHRYIGRLYLLSVVCASITAVPMALMAEGGWTTRLSFLLLATMWVVTGSLAYRTVRKKQFQAHRRWMIRNYSLTYSAVISRLLLNYFMESGYGFEAVYEVVTWSWLCGLGVGEWWIWYSRKRKR